MTYSEDGSPRELTGNQGEILRWGTICPEFADPASITGILGSGITIQDEGTILNNFSQLNFVGGGVAATDAGGGVADITISAGSSPSGVTVQDEGTIIDDFSQINFIGVGVVAADAGGGVASVTIAGPSGITVQDEGTIIDDFFHLNFVGEGVTATDGGAGVATITIPALSGVTVQDEGTIIGDFDHINFIGAGVTATDGGSNVADVTIVGDGSGDVGAFTPSTDNAIVRYNGTGGNSIQNSDVIVTDSGNIEENRLITFIGEVNNGLSGTTPAINWREGQKQAITLNNNATFVFVNPPEACNLLLRLIQDAGGTNTAAWPTGVLFPGGTDPVLTVAGDAIDIVSFYYDGNQYYGVASLDFS
jgi:hypothetical protein